MSDILLLAQSRFIYCIDGFGQKANDKILASDISASIIADLM
ncbi:MAG: hypothetical protein AB7S72_01380 [Draconibacterium sp.]